MKQGSTLFLRLVLLLLGVPVLIACIYWLPKNAAAHPHDFVEYVLLFGAYSMAALFFVGLYQALKLLTYIDKNKLFSKDSVSAMKIIKYCSITATLLILAGIVFLRVVVKGDDPAGPTSVGLITAFVLSVIATCAAVLQKLLQNAVDIKSENDLTV